MHVGDQVRTPDGRGTILSILDATHPMRTDNPTGWQYADGTLVAAETVLYIVTVRDSHNAVYEAQELALWG